MFIIELTYKVTLTDVEPHFDGHMAFVAKYYETGHFVASGKKEPRDGGIIFATAQSRDEIIAVMQEDPFIINDVAEFRITEFLPSNTIDELSALKTL